MDNNELKHYGVLGMRWGVRRKRQGEDSEDSVKARRAASKNINEMSNQELREANERIRLEQEHERLVKNGLAGKKIVAGIIATGATVAALTLAAHRIQSGAKKGKEMYDSAANKIGDRLISELGSSYKKNPRLTN